VEVLEAADAKPTVKITKLSDGTITYSVTATARDVRLALKRAKEAFSDLGAYAELVKNAGLSEAMAKTLAEMNHR